MVLLTVVLLFAMAGHLLFGRDLVQFCDLGEAFQTCLLMILGEVYFEPMLTVDFFAAVVFQLVYMYGKSVNVHICRKQF